MSFPIPPQIFYPYSFPYLLPKKSSPFWKDMQICWKKPPIYFSCTRKNIWLIDCTCVPKHYVGWVLEKHMKIILKSPHVIFTKPVYISGNYLYAFWETVYT